MAGLGAALPCFAAGDLWAVGGGAAVFAFFCSRCSSLTPCFAADGRAFATVTGEATSIEAKEWDEDGRLDKPLLGYHAH